MNQELILDGWLGYDEAVAAWNDKYQGKVTNIKLLQWETDNIKKTRVRGEGTKRKYKIVKKKND